jgi:hypothetical protein
MTTYFRVFRALAVSMALSASGASIALADSPASLQAGSDVEVQTVPSTSVVAKNALRGAQPVRHAKAGAAGGVDYQGFRGN